MTLAISKMADELAAAAGGKIAAKKKMGHKCCAAANCNFRSDNRPDLSFHEFPKDYYLKKKWEVKMRRGDATFKNIANKFVVLRIFCHRISNRV